MNIIDRVLLITVSFAVPVGCSHNIRTLAAVTQASEPSHRLSDALWVYAKRYPLGLRAEPSAQNLASQDDGGGAYAPDRPLDGTGRITEANASKLLRKIEVYPFRDDGREPKALQSPKETMGHQPRNAPFRAPQTTEPVLVGVPLRLASDGALRHRLALQDSEALASVVPTAAVTVGHNLQIASQEMEEAISLSELLEYLPKTPSGWTAAEPKGETNSWGDYHVSQVAQTYTKGNKEITVSIFDCTFNSVLQLPLLLANEFSRESTEGYNKGIKIDGIPGREEYSYDSKQGSLNLLVDNKFLVQIDGKNIEDMMELREWWQLIELHSWNETTERQAKL